MRSKLKGSLVNIGNGFNVWIDLTDPTNEEVEELAKKFILDPIALETYFNKSKKAEIRVLDNHTFMRVKHFYIELSDVKDKRF